MPVRVTAAQNRDHRSCARTAPIRLGIDVKVRPRRITSRASPSRRLDSGASRSPAPIDRPAPPPPRPHRSSTASEPTIDGRARGPTRGYFHVASPSIFVPLESPRGGISETGANRRYKFRRISRRRTRRTRTATRTIIWATLAGTNTTNGTRDSPCRPRVYTRAGRRRHRDAESGRGGRRGARARRS